MKAKPLHGLGGQVMEIAAYDSSGTYRAVYAKPGIATPKPEMHLMRQRLKQLRSEVKNAKKSDA